MENIRPLEKIVGNGRVAVVDSSMQFKDIVQWQRAITMLVANEAYTLIPHGSGKLVRSPSIAIEMPLVVSLHRFVPYREHYLIPGETASKHMIRVRDGWTCQYCFKYGRTIDHIMPKSRGGLSTWENLCVACEKCNAQKRNRTPQEAGMRVPAVPERRKIHVPRTKHQTMQQAIHEELETMLGIVSDTSPVAEYDALNVSVS